MWGIKSVAYPSNHQVYGTIETIRQTIKKEEFHRLQNMI